MTMPSTATDLQPALLESQRLPLRPWMPPRWRRAVAGREVELRIPEPVRRRVRKPKTIPPPSEWSVKERRMPAADSHPGQYRVEFARFAAKVMDTWALPWVREVCFCGVDQASKTNTMLSCIGWSRRYRPGNIFYQMPDEASSDRIMGKKLIPMLKGTPSLAAHLSPRADDTTLGGVTFADGVAIIPSWSGSLTSTATFAARDTFSDEIDKMKMVGNEADPRDRIRKRSRTNRFAKHFFASTPAGLWIYSMTMACVQVWAAAGRCPDCGELVVMDEDHVVIPEGATVDSIKADPGCIEYACTCGALWDESARALAYEHGDWVCIKGVDVARPVDVGFLLPAFPLPDVSLSSIAQTILRARAGDISAKRDLAHGIKAIDYKEDTKERKEDTILRLCDDRPAGQVHPESDVLTIHIDTQDRGFWYTLRGWRYGEDLKSWLVKAGYVPSNRSDDFSALDHLIFDSEYRDGAGKSYRISYGIIDSQGHRTSEVYAWCKRTGIFAARGAQGRKTKPVSVSNQDFFPGKNKPIPGGLQLYTLDTHFHKDTLNHRLQIDPSDPGAWVLHSGYSAIQHLLMEKNPGIKLANGLGDYAKQMCVEYRDDKGLWQCPEGKANHLWDCEQMAIALALYLGFQNMVRDEETHEPPPPPAPSAGSGRPSWFHNRR